MKMKMKSVLQAVFIAVFTVLAVASLAGGFSNHVLWIYTVGSVIMIHALCKYW